MKFESIILDFHDTFDMGIFSVKKKIEKRAIERNMTKLHNDVKLS